MHIIFLRLYVKLIKRMSGVCASINHAALLITCDTKTLNLREATPVVPGTSSGRVAKPWWLPSHALPSHSWSWNDG